jgi:hypothetical protein
MLWSGRSDRDAVDFALTIDPFQRIEADRRRSGRPELHVLDACRRRFR